MIPSNLPPHITTLVDLLAWRAQQQPDKIAYTFLRDGETDKVHITYGELDQQARAIARNLQQVASPGDRALLLYPSGLDFIAGFFGCLYAGVIAVPAYPPHRKRTDPRLLAIAADAQPSAVLTMAQLYTDINERLEQMTELTHVHWFKTDVTSPTQSEEWQKPRINGDTLAFLQYTSGSTGTPKGVMVSHGNLLANQDMIRQAFEHTEQTIFCGWLPLFHDMGLVGNVLQPLYLGIPSILMAPAAFLQKPLRWLQAISRYRATTSGSPNFGYELCVSKISPTEMAGLDLSSWDIAFNGAEPVRVETLDRFTATFGPYGFRRETFFPCYGMAETTLFVSGGPKAEVPPICYAEKNELAQHRIRLSDNQPSGYQPIVSCGRSWLDQRIVIVNPTTHRPCAADEVGEIWIAGPHVAQGYWNQPEATQKTFRAYLADAGDGPFLRTGDLGFLHNGELFVTGRLKDLIIIRGQNHYPQDIEQTVADSHLALQPGGGAAFTIDADGEARLVIVQEVSRSHLRELDIDSVMQAIQSAVSTNHQLRTHSITLLKPGHIPKTSSGKVQRNACRIALLDRSLAVMSQWQSPEIAETKTASLMQRWEGQANGTHNDGTKVEKIHIARNPTEMTQTSQVTETDTSRRRTDELIAWLRDYAENHINSRLIDERRTIPPHIVLDFGNRGLLGTQVSPTYGGLGLNCCDGVRLIEQLSAIDLTLAVFVANHNILGVGPIQKFATETAKAELLPPLATGRELAGFALTEPGAGSNPRALATQAIATGPNQWQLRGTKIWTGSAAWSGVLNVFARHPETSQISGFIVRRGTPGLRMGPEALTMGMRGMVQNKIHLHDVPVGGADLLGESGRGVDAAQDAMMYARMILAAASVGGMKRCAQLMTRYASRRTISTGNLLDNAVTLGRLSELSATITAVHTLVTQGSRLLDLGWTIPAELSAIAKIAGSEFYWRAADALMQMMGGRGYIETNMAPQMLRDARILRIFEGPTETLTMFVGSCMVGGSEEVYQFLSRGFNAPQVSERLRNAVDEIRERHSSANRANHQQRAVDKQWLYTLVGDVVLYATLLASLRGVPTSTTNVSRAAAWAEYHFERAIAVALNPPRTAVDFLGRDEVVDLVSEYAATIGDIEQSLADEDREVDDLLRRSPVDSRGISLSTDSSHSNALSVQETLSIAPDPKNKLVTESVNDSIEHQSHVLVRPIGGHRQLTTAPAMDSESKDEDGRTSLKSIDDPIGEIDQLSEASLAQLLASEIASVRERRAK